MPNLSLYSAWYCPFAQRTWIALEHIERPYTYIEIDPYNKTKIWMEVSRGLGQVPVIAAKHSQKTVINIPDSTRTLEYLEDIEKSGALFSLEPDHRAEQLYWIDFQGRKIIPHFYQFLRSTQNSDSEVEAKEKLILGLSTFTQAMSDEGGFFNGSRPSAVDFSLAPFALRIELLLSHYKDFTLPTDGIVWARYQRWWVKMQTNTAFSKTMGRGDAYNKKLIDFYLTYAQGGGQKDAATGSLHN